MNISKTQFKNFTRCKCYYQLSDLYKNGLDSETLAILEKQKNDGELLEFAYEVLGQFYDENSGEDLIAPDLSSLEVLQVYYDRCEREAMRILNKYYPGKFKTSIGFGNQKRISAQVEDGHQLYTYLDGYADLGDREIVVEVKASTDKKFRELAYTDDGESILLYGPDPFCTDGLQLRDIEDFLDKVKYQNNKDKLQQRYGDLGKYVYDVAVSAYFFDRYRQQQNLPNKPVEYKLVVLNSQYVFDGKVDNDGIPVYGPNQDGNDIMTIIDVTEAVAEWQPEIHRQFYQLLATVKLTEKQESNLGKHCEDKKKTQCIFFKYCWKNLLEPYSVREFDNVHNGVRAAGDVKGDNNRVDKYVLFNDKTHQFIKDFELDELKTEKQKIQWKAVMRDEEYWDAEKIAYGLDQLQYPIYHLDFETFNGPLPRFYGEKPYTQSVFQWSIHIEHEPGVCDKDKDHYEFLAKTFKDERREMVKQMVEIIDLSKGGKVLVYNDSFEKTRLKELAAIFPEYENQLLAIHDAVFDLMDIVKTRGSVYKEPFGEARSKIFNYYHKRLRGSFSIKKVLPVFSDISYDDMEISHGGEAIIAYGKFRTASPEEIEKTRKDLLEYCKQDTWAMVVILDEIRKRNRIELQKQKS